MYSDITLSLCSNHPCRTGRGVCSGCFWPRPKNVNYLPKDVYWKYICISDIYFRLL